MKLKIITKEAIECKLIHTYALIVGSIYHLLMLNGSYQKKKIVEAFLPSINWVFLHDGLKRKTKRGWELCYFIFSICLCIRKITHFVHIVEFFDAQKKNLRTPWAFPWIQER